MSSDDIKVISEVLNGNIDSFALLIDKYKLKIFKIVSVHVPSDYVEEVANDIFFKAYKSLKSFRQESSFISWLTVIAIRTCKDYWRKAYAKKDVPLSSFDDEVEQTIELGIDYNTPEDFVINKQEYQLLMKAMEYLKPVERTILVMMYAEERSVVETAEIVGLTQTNVKVIAFRAKKRLVKILNKIQQI